MSGLLAMSFHIVYRFPDEPGLLPDPFALEQQVLWAIVGFTLIIVIASRARARMRRSVA